MYHAIAKCVCNVVRWEVLIKAAHNFAGKSGPVRNTFQLSNPVCLLGWSPTEFSKVYRHDFLVTLAFSSNSDLKNLVMILLHYYSVVALE